MLLFVTGDQRLRKERGHYGRPIQDFRRGTLTLFGQDSIMVQIQADPACVDSIERLDRHLDGRSYLFGERDPRTRISPCGGTWTQKPQKYHAKSLGMLRQKFAAFEHNQAVTGALEQTDCLKAFA